MAGKKIVVMTEEVQASRDEMIAKPHPCYDGQWKVHLPHEYEMRLQNWLGGGTEMVTCPGVKPGETLPERHAHAASERAGR